MEFKFRYQRQASGDPITWGKFLVAKLTDSIGVIVAGQYIGHSNIPTGVGRQDLIGAGKFNKEGKITEWNSVNYNLTTPETLRPEIEKVFDANKVQIKGDVWRKKK